MNFLNELTYKYLYLKYYLLEYPLYKLIFKRIGKRSKILSVLRLEYPENIIIGDNVIIGFSAWLAATKHINADPNLVISDGCTLGDYNEIYCIKEVILEKNVFTAKNVYISDNTHSYKDINIPVFKQEVVLTNSVRIGESAWLGINVCVLGASVGKHSVIGANSVVTTSIPDYCVAVGAPAKIVKRYDFETKIWRKTNSKGEFIDE